MSTFLMKKISIFVGFLHKIQVFIVDVNFIQKIWNFINPALNLESSSIVVDI